MKITWLPYNHKTSTLFYDQRAAISEPREEPIVWMLSKVEDTNVRGIARYTWKQDKWNSKTDYIEQDVNGIVTGVWCDYYTNGDVLPTPVDTIPTPSIYSSITFSGFKPDIKAGGHYKKFTVTFFDGGAIIDHKEGNWLFTVNGIDISDKIKTLSAGESKDVTENQIKVKLDADNSMIGKILLVGYESYDGIKSEIEINIVGN